MGFALEQFRNTWVQHLLLMYSLIRQQVCCKRHTAAYISPCGKRGAHMGSPYIFAIAPTPLLFPVKK